MSARIWLSLSALAVLASTPACRFGQQQDEPLSLGEAQQAVEEASLSTQASMLVNGTIEISTNFTIGDAVEQAAEELRTFIETQLPCADITLQGATLSIEYGAKPGNCIYRGHSYSGEHTITVARNDEGDVEVAHEWTELSNGLVSVSGNADVTWSWLGASRHVTHELTWTRLRDGMTGSGSGDHTETVLDGGLQEGLLSNGWLSWEGKSGTWDLAIDDVEIRWIDPVPQAGTYSLTTPFGKDVAMSFERQDEDTIAVVVSSGEREFTILVNSVEF